MVLSLFKTWGKFFFFIDLWYKWNLVISEPQRRLADTLIIVRTGNLGEVAEGL